MTQGSLTIWHVSLSSAVEKVCRAPQEENPPSAAAPAHSLFSLLPAWLQNLSQAQHHALRPLPALGMPPPIRQTPGLLSTPGTSSPSTFATRTVWKADASIPVRSCMAFLFFNYFSHTACALTHITNKAGMTQRSETFLHPFISFRNISSQVTFSEDIISVYISAKITTRFQFQRLVLQMNMVQFSLGFTVRVRSRPLKHS